MLRPSFLAIIFCSVFGCSSPSPFRCDRPGASCAAPGVCVEGYCALPALDCASGRRFGSTAARPGVCVDPAISVDAATLDAPEDTTPARDVDTTEAVDAVSLDAPTDAPVDAPPADAPLDAPPADASLDAPPADASVDVPVVLPGVVAFVRPIFSRPSAAAVVAMAVGDLDADGILDVGVARVDHRVELFHGAGDGTFTPVGSLAAPGVRGLSLTDVNGDGRADVVALGTDVIVWPSRLDGLMPDPTMLGSSMGGTTLRIGQVFGTAARDLVIGLPSSNQLLVISNPMEGGIVRVFFPTPVRPDTLEVVDLDRNGDGLAEVVVLSSTGVGDQVGVMPGNSDGPGARKSTSLLPSTSRAIHGRSLAFGDYNGDGLTEPVVVDDSGITFLDNPRTRELTANGRIALGTPLLAGTTGLLDGDTLSDVVVIGEGDGLVHLFSSPFTGTPAPVSFAVPGAAVAVATGDFNRDGADDVLVYADGFHVLAGRRNGTLAAPRAFRTCPAPVATALTGLDTDRASSVAVVCGAAPALNVHAVDRALSLVGITTTSLAFTATDLIVGPIDRDAVPDLLPWTRSGRRALPLFVGLSGGLTLGSPFATGSRITPGALDADPALDLAVATGDRLSTATNRDGVFTERSMIRMSGRDFTDLQTADLDGDARPEVLALDSAHHELVATTADTAGALETTSRTYALRDGATWVLAASMAPLGRLDLVVGFRAGTDVEVLRRSGAMLRVTGRSDTTGTTLGGITTGLVSADACTDVVTWLASGTRLDVHPGDCAGGLGPHVKLPTFLATHVTVADVDRDGRSDLVVAHSLGPTRTGYFTVWINAAR